MIRQSLRNYEAALADESRDLADAEFELAKALVRQTGNQCFWNAEPSDAARFAAWLIENDEQKARRVELVNALRGRLYDHERDTREPFRHEATP
jgi:hypothetical protein